MSRDDPQALAELEAKPLGPRTIGYLRLLGPGYMQSAMTLGGGTAFSAIFAGAAFGYELLWVAPVAMALGIIVLAAVAHQMLSTDEDPFQAMKTHAGPVFAYGWAFSGIFSSIIWQFAQYALASSMLQVVAASIGIEYETWVFGVLCLAWCIALAFQYDRGSGLVRLYETVLKAMVWFIILCFAFVVIRTGIPSPGDLTKGLVPFRIPTEGRQGVEALTVVVAGLAAAVGANMVFVYPYTLRKRGWGKAHRRLARIDLIFGMLVPYTIAASLILVASASIFYYAEPELFEGKTIAPKRVAEILADPGRLGAFAGLWIFGLGVVAMALSSITMQMLCSGFALCEIAGHEAKGATYRLGMLLPAVGVLGSVYWNEVRVWMAVPTTVICGFLLPFAYVGFILLQRSDAYLGDEKPRGGRGKLWFAGMIVSTLVLVVFLVQYAIEEVPGWLEDLGG